MLEALKSLFENEALSEEVRTELEEAWNAKVKENPFKFSIRREWCNYRQEFTGRSVIPKAF